MGRGGCAQTPPVACASGVVVAAKALAVKRAVRAVIVRVDRRLEGATQVGARVVESPRSARTPFSRRYVRASTEVANPCRIATPPSPPPSWRIQKSLNNIAPTFYEDPVGGDLGMARCLAGPSVESFVLESNGTL